MSVWIPLGVFVALCACALVWVTNNGADFRDRCERAGGIAISVTSTDRQCINGHRVKVDTSWFGDHR